MGTLHQVGRQIPTAPPPEFQPQDWTCVVDFDFDYWGEGGGGEERPGDGRRRGFGAPVPAGRGRGLTTVTVIPTWTPSPNTQPPGPKDILAPPPSPHRTHGAAGFFFQGRGPGRCCRRQRR